MRKFIQFIYKRPILITFVIIMIIFVPIMFVMQPQSQMKLIVRTIGIDMVDDQVEVTLICYQPSTSQAYTESYSLISAKGDTLSLAMDLAGDYAGKQLLLSHVSNIAVSSKILEDDIVKHMNHLIRSYVINNSTNMFMTNVSAKEFLQETLKTHGKTANQESGIVEHNENFVAGVTSNIETALISSYAPNKTTLINILKIGNNEGEDLSGESQSSGSSNTDGSSSQEGQSSGGKDEKKFLVNDGSLAIIREGKKIGELDREEVRALSYANSKGVWQKIEIKNFEDENFKKADIVLNIPDKDVTYSAYFDDDVPTINIKTKLQVTIYEAIQEEQSKNIYSAQNYFITKELEQEISKKIKDEFYPVYEKIKSLNADPFNFYLLLHSKHKDKFQQYLNSLENPENYIQGIKVVLEVECEGK